MGFAQYRKNFGALIQAVNVIGSLSMEAARCLRVAFFFARVGAKRRLHWRARRAERLSSPRRDLFTSISFLWYNVIGCLVVIVVGVAVSRIFDRGPTRRLPAPMGVH